MTNVRALNNSDLLAKLTFLVTEEKKNIAAQIVLLKEVRRRKLALEMHQGFGAQRENCPGAEILPPRFAQGQDDKGGAQEQDDSAQLTIPFLNWLKGLTTAIKL